MYTCLAFKELSQRRPRSFFLRSGLPPFGLRLCNTIPRRLRLHAPPRPLPPLHPFQLEIIPAHRATEPPLMIRPDAGHVTAAAIKQPAIRTQRAAQVKNLFRPAREFIQDIRPAPQPRQRERLKYLYLPRRPKLSLKTSLGQLPPESPSPLRAAKDNLVIKRRGFGNVRTDDRPFDLPPARILLNDIFSFTSHTLSAPARKTAATAP